MKNILMQKKAFTLMELLAVIMILSILVAIAMPQYNIVVERSRSAEGISILSALRGAQLRYYVEHSGNYAGDFDSIDVDFSSSTFFSSLTVSEVEPIARIERSSVQYGFGSDPYELDMYANGDIICRGNSAQSICEKMGYNYAPGAVPVCFLAGTPITMVDGSIKFIENIKTGDMVLAFDEKTGKAIADQVKATTVHNVNKYLLVNNNLKVTPEHPFYSNGKYVPIGQLRIGDNLMNKDAELEDIFDIQEVNKEVTVYNFDVNPHHNYFAGGYLVHNKIEYEFE